MRKWVVKPMSCEGGDVQAAWGSPGPKRLTDEGVPATNKELVRGGAGVSGSPLDHYFSNKENLVLAVMDWQADSIRRIHSSEQRELMDRSVHPRGGHHVKTGCLAP